MVDAQTPSATANAQQANSGAPFLSAVMQYIKDFSLENPRAPESFRATAGSQPQINVDMNVAARHLEGEHYELVLVVKADAKADGNTMFIVELAYAGLFALRNFPEQAIRPALMIEGAHLLFPFARQIIADATAKAGFPPLLINPVDFTALYRDTLKQNLPQTEAAAEATS